ncbi:reverse transcriptase family protein [Limnoglobus roseus]|nr:reverse transcriptase family protein [Limnoglobus roseus]
MAPHQAARGWLIPEITTAEKVCEVLRIDRHQLDWLADCAGRNHRESSPKLHHYRYRWIPKPSGRSRVLEIPKPILKQVQRNVLGQILDAIPPHAAAHGFRIGRSILTNAVPHSGRAVVLRFDLAIFFSSISADAVTAIFRTAGYPPDVARQLTGLCTTRLPKAVWDQRPRPAADGSDSLEERHLRNRHLPQGAPTSPALANLVAFRLDRRLDGLAKSLDVTYTRYADDLAFSGGIDLTRRSEKFRNAVARIVSEEGFRLNPLKTRVMPQSVRQTVAGVVVNIRTSIPRAEFDRLKAVLTNCLRHGPESQNREAHPNFRAYLAGKLAHVARLNPTRGRKLLALFDQIRWQSA